MRDRPAMLRILAVTVLVLIAPVEGARAQQLDIAVLRSRGLAAYRRLPARVTLRDARTFAEALRYLYAYEQRAHRVERPIARDESAAIGWLVQRIANLETAKADLARSDEAMLTRGMAMYRQARESEVAGEIWDVPAFLSASANLFAYIQCVKDPHGDAVTAHAWLVEARNRLVIAGGAADDPRSRDGWLPDSPRPGAPRPGGVAAEASIGAAAANPSFVIPTRPALSNVALRKRAVQSSTVYDAAAARAVDGRSDGNWRHGSVSHTDSLPGSWWMVDLGAEHRIDSITIFNRTDCCTQRLDAVVAVTSAEGWPSSSVRFLVPLGRPRARFDVPVSSWGPVFGRYVYVVLNGTSWLSLAEVEVKGVPR